MNLWNEIETVVHYRDPRTGIASEEINPRGKKYCKDHALEAAGYGIHKRTMKPSIRPEDPNRLYTSDEILAAFREDRERRFLEQEQEKRRPSWLRQGL